MYMKIHEYKKIRVDTLIRIRKQDFLSQDDYDFFMDDDDNWLAFGYNFTIDKWGCGNTLKEWIINNENCITPYDELRMCKVSAPEHWVRITHNKKEVNKT